MKNQSPKCMMINKIKSFFDKKIWLVAESNHGHEDFQSSALPTELTSHILFNFREVGFKQCNCSNEFIIVSLRSPWS